MALILWVGVRVRRSIVALCRWDRYTRLVVRVVVDHLADIGAALGAAELP